MKKFLLLSLSLIFFVCSCNKTEQPIVSGYNYVFNISKGETKSTIGSDCIEWSTTDKVANYVLRNDEAINSNGYSNVTQSEDKWQINIYSDVALTSGDKVFCYYPSSSSNADVEVSSVGLQIPDSQTQASSFYASAMPMVSIPIILAGDVSAKKATPVDDIYMINLGSIIEFNLYTLDNYETDAIRSVTFTSEDAIAGSFTIDLTCVDYADESTYALNALSKLSVQTKLTASLTAGGSKENGTKVYMVVAPGNHKGTVSILTENSKYEYNVSSPIAFRRSTIKPLNVCLDENHKVASDSQLYKWVKSEFSSITSSDVFAVVEHKADGYYAMGNENPDRNRSVETVNVENDVFRTNKSIGWILNEKETGKYTLRSEANSLYLYNKSAVDTNLSDEEILWVLGSGNVLKASVSGRYLYMGTSDWRAYTAALAGGPEMQYYKRISTRYVTGIEVSGTASDVFVGLFNHIGITVTATFSDGNTEDVTSLCSFQCDVATAGTKNVLVTYTNEGTTLETSYEVNVVSSPLSSISISGTYPVVFLKGASFSTGDMIVTVSYLSGYSKNVDVNSCVFLGFDSSSASTQTITVSYTEDGNTVSTNYSVSISDSAGYTVTLSDDQTSIVEASSGAGVSLPNRNAPEGMEFCGWCESSITSTTVRPTIISTDDLYHPNSNIILYPVYSSSSTSTSWVKTAANSISGEGVYVLITTDGHVFNGTISSGHGQVTADAFSFDTNDTATSLPSGACELTFKSSGTGYTMYNSNYGYLYASAKKSGSLAWHQTENSYWLYKSSNWLYNSNSTYLRSYNNNSIRTYGANNGDVLVMAKKVVATVVTYTSSVE